jgi:hypothetical protein
MALKEASRIEASKMAKISKAWLKIIGSYRRYPHRGEEASWRRGENGPNQHQWRHQLWLKWLDNIQWHNVIYWRIENVSANHQWRHPVALTEKIGGGSCRKRAAKTNGNRIMATKQWQAVMAAKACESYRKRKAAMAGVKYGGSSA